MTQALYAHMNNKERKKKRKENAYLKKINNELENVPFFSIFYMKF
jgi:hypothetical protein